MKKAFSLIEISVVILVIGILISGISSGVDLYNDYKIVSARNFTTNSKISRIPDIGFWMDTTRLKSIETASGSYDPKNGDKIKSWYSINFLNPEDKIIAIQTNASHQPTYLQNGRGGLPTILFEESTGGNFLSIPYDIMFSDPYFEIYVALKSNGVTSRDVPIASGQEWQNGWTVSLNGDANFYSLQTYKNGGWWQMYYPATPLIKKEELKLLRVIASDGILYVSDMKYSSGGNYNYTTGGWTHSSSPFLIGRQSVLSYQLHYFNGEISEIIYFRRNLNDSERLSVKEYFNDKYKINI